MIDDDKLVEIIEKAISDNFESLTDPSLHDAVYMVGMDVAEAVIETIKESRKPKTGRGSRGPNRGGLPK